MPNLRNLLHQKEKPSLPFDGIMLQLNKLLELSIGKNMYKEGEWEQGRSGENKDREEVLIFFFSTSPFSLFTFSPMRSG